MLRNDLFSIPFLKKSPYYGEYQKMRFCIRKNEDKLEVCVYPGPFNLQNTPADKVESTVFDFTEDGYAQAKDWLEEKAASRDWEKAILPF